MNKIIVGKRQKRRYGVNIKETILYFYTHVY